MSTSAKKTDPFQQPLANLQELTIAANMICKTGNPYELRNSLIIHEIKRQVLYKNGYTLPVGAQVLLNEAASKIRHARKLAANMHKADPTLKKHAELDTHHIVAAQDRRATEARKIMFGNQVGVNDAANGRYTPRKKACSVPGMGMAIPHENIHTDTYYVYVTMQMETVRATNADTCRKRLRQIGDAIVAGTFPY